MNRFSNILFVAEAGVNAAPAFSQAVTVAKNNQAQLTMVGIVEDSGTRQAKDLQDAMIKQRREEMEAIVQAAPSASPNVEIKVLIGKAFVEIIRDVIRFRRDLVIKSVDTNQSVGEQLFGGNDKKLLRKCPCPIWLIRSTKEQGDREILVALDYEPENPESDPLNRQLLEMASSIALSEFNELHVVHAWQLEHESFLRSPRTGLTNEEVDNLVRAELNRRQQWLTKLVSEVISGKEKETVDYLKPRVHLMKGSADDVVPKCAADLGAELIVMGTVARTGMPGLIIGNTAENILSQLHCSVLAVKPVGFISPVTLAG